MLTLMIYGVYEMPVVSSPLIALNIALSYLPSTLRKRKALLENYEKFKTGK